MTADIIGWVGLAVYAVATSYLTVRFAARRLLTSVLDWFLLGLVWTVGAVWALALVF